MKKIFASFLIAIFVFSSFPVLAIPINNNVYAAQLVKVSGYLSKDRKYVYVTFSNLKDTKYLGYTLTYTSNGIGQGVVGGITPSKKTSSVTKRIFLGTCSGWVCRLHTNVSDIKLLVQGTYRSGKTFSILIKIKS